jgi:hypothetical protein
LSDFFGFFREADFLVCLFCFVAGARKMAAANRLKFSSASGPSVYSGCFHMDYVTRQFIVLAKKLRKELRKALFTLSDSLQKQTKSIDEAKESYRQQRNEPQSVSAEIRLPPEVERQRQTQDNRSHAVQVVIAFATCGTFIAAAIYGAIAFLQWRTADQAIKEAREATTKQLSTLSQTITEARNANSIAIAANRPWVGFSEGIKGDVDFVRNRNAPANVFELRHIWRMKNAGKRPAQVIRVNTTANWSKNCIETPNYDRMPRDLDKNLAVVYERQGKGARTLLIPDATNYIPFAMMLPPDKWNKTEKRIVDTCLYIRIEYRDADYPAIIHHTTACRVAIPQMEVFGECTNDYASAD